MLLHPCIPSQGFCNGCKEKLCLEEQVEASEGSSGGGGAGVSTLARAAAEAQKLVNSSRATLAAAQENGFGRGPSGEDGAWIPGGLDSGGEAYLPGVAAPYQAAGMGGGGRASAAAAAAGGGWVRGGGLTGVGPQSMASLAVAKQARHTRLSLSGRTGEEINRCGEGGGARAVVCFATWGGYRMPGSRGLPWPPVAIT